MRKDNCKGNPKHNWWNMRYALLFITLILVIGCDSDIEEQPVPAVLQKTIPIRGKNVPVNGEILLVFNKRPVNFRTDSLNGFRFLDEIEDDRQLRFLVLRNIPIRDHSKMVVILGPFTFPVVEFKVYWGATDPQQSATLGYIVTGPI